MQEGKMTVTDIQNVGSEAQKIVLANAEANEVLGMIRAFDVVGKFVTVTNLKILHDIKESKKYKGLVKKLPDGKVVTVTNWSEYCQFLPVSKDTIDQHLMMLKEFGEDFLSRAQDIGMGLRDMRKLRSLPDESDRNLIIEATQQEHLTRDDVLELMEEMAAKHSKEKTELTAKLEDVTGDLESVRKISAEKTKHLDEAREQLERTRRQIADADPEAVGEELRLNLSAVQVSIESEMTKLRPLLEQLIEHGQVNGVDHTPTIVGCLNQIIRNSEYLRESYHLPQEAPTDEIPAWVKAMQDEGKVN